MTRPRDRLAPVIRLAPAKLNLTLAIVGRRPDGFHALHSVMAPLALADRLSLAPAAGATDTLHVAGPSGEARDPAGYDSVPRAIAEARRVVGRGAETFAVAARLEKRIPVAAGLAGGSSDAAAALDAALEAWGADASPSDRAAAAARLGSDVPFFLAGGFALVEGRGESVRPLRGPLGLPPGLLLVTPAAPSSTARAFAAVADGTAPAADPRSTRRTSEHLAAELAAGLRSEDLVRRAGVLAVANDLVAAAELHVPGLRGLRASLRRTLGRPIGLSGSGPTLWALYPSLEDATAAASLVEAAVADGTLTVPGESAPFVAATTFAAGAADAGKEMA